MAIHAISMIGDPILRQTAKKIHHFDPSLPKLVKDMFETMHDARGIGLAAPQIALSLRLFVIEYDDKETEKHYKIAMANPEIVKAEGEQIGQDGCLSIPGYYGTNVRRANKILVKGQNIRGKPMKVQAEGLFAWALQHEIDHLNGILYTDHLDSPDDLHKVQSEEAGEELGAVE